MRYEKRFANGYWRSFDTVNYTTVAIYDTQAECDKHLNVLNKPK